jgi:tripeptide aminopeptidase
VRLEDRFVRLCEIPSPTGQERQVADAVTEELRGLGLEVVEDDAAETARAGSGNLLARVPGREDRWVTFCAHLDTVPHEGPIEVALENGVYRSRGETILGADDKAAVAVLIELAARRVASPPEVGVELLFTVAEEDGLRGAQAFDLARLRSGFGFVLDHATPIGELIIAAPSYQRIVADFVGDEAHAGIRPEAGHSAIAAASAAVAAMELGRLDEQTTANVGLIRGGTAANVVPARCRIEGEARGIEASRAAEVAGSMSDACTFGATEHGCDVEVEIEELWRAYRIPSGSVPLRVASAALERTGHEVRRITTGAGSDAHALIAAGFDCLLLANGTEANHTSEESVAADSLERMLGVCEAILEEAARC